MNRAPILLATRSEGKLRELEPMFAAAGLLVTDPTRAEIVETDEEQALERYETFEENALAKARYFARITGGRAIADDSGLEVLALGGRPGVHSKRWSEGEGVGPATSGWTTDAANNALLVRSLAGVVDRRARYVCVAAFAEAGNGTEGELVVRGETAGLIVDEPVGSGGFGYDPHFLSSDLGTTFAVADRVEKERVSHRGRAFRALIARLRQQMERAERGV